MSTMRGSPSSRKKFLFFSYSSSSIIFTWITLLQEGRGGTGSGRSEGGEKKRKVNLWWRDTGSALWGLIISIEEKVRGKGQLAVGLPVCYRQVRGSSLDGTDVMTTAFVIASDWSRKHKVENQPGRRGGRNNTAEWKTAACNQSDCKMCEQATHKDKKRWANDKWKKPSPSGSIFMAWCLSQIAFHEIAPPLSPPCCLWGQIRERCLSAPGYCSCLRRTPI